MIPTLSQNGPNIPDDFPKLLVVRPLEVLDVLLISNDLFSHDALAARLAANGAQVFCAAGRHEAFDLVHTQTFDTIIVDIRPDAIALETVRALRLAGVTARILLVSAGSIKKAGIEAGADGVMPLDSVAAYNMHKATDGNDKPQTVSLGSVAVDAAKKMVFAHGRAMALSADEYVVFSALAERPGVFVGEAFIDARLKNDGGPGLCARRIVRQLGRKLAEGLGAEISIAVRAQGFCLSQHAHMA